MTKKDRVGLESFLGAATPPDTVFQAYTEEAEALLRFSKGFRGLPFSRPRLIMSQLFKRPYLVANFCDESPPGLQSMDACAHLGLEIHVGLITPPMVLTSSASLFSKRAYRSILEHEFVHVNQILQGKFPVALDSTRGAPLRYLGELTELEYEAHFLQLSHWGELYDQGPNRGMTLEQWCTFRAYTSSLESLLMSILQGAVSSACVRDFLKNGPGLLGDVFSRARLDKAMGEAYGLLFPQHIQSALLNCTNCDVKFVPRFHRLLTDWLEGQRGRIVALERALGHRSEAR